jgi:putative salt-induced outer membrane protein
MRTVLTALLLAGIAAQPVLAQAQAQSQALPESVRQMVEAAAKSGDKAKIDAVVAIAKETNKGAEAEIDKIVADISAAQAAEREAKLATAGFFENWKGSGQLGASISTGNTEQKSLTAGLNLERDGLNWRHRADAIIDIVDNDGGTDQQRILAGYQIDYKFSETLYAWGRFEYEKNREAGIERRFAESAGLGWRAVNSGRVTWDLEAGPALRQTRFVTTDENSLAVRGASRFLWNISDTSAFSNDTAIFWDSAGSIANTTALTSKLFGSLSARLSVNLAWEQEPPLGLEKLDTTSRVTLVYTF